MPNPYVQQLKELDKTLEGTEPPAQFDAQLEHLFEVVPAAVLFQDVSGKIVRSNARATEVLGTQPEGKTGKEIFRDHARRMTIDSQVLVTGIPKRGELHEHVRPDGRKVWLLTDRVAHHDSMGRIDGLLVFSVDVTSVVARR